MEKHKIPEAIAAHILLPIIRAPLPDLRAIASNPLDRQSPPSRVTFSRAAFHPTISCSVGVAIVPKQYRTPALFSLVPLNRQSSPLNLLHRCKNSFPPHSISNRFTMYHKADDSTRTSGSRPSLIFYSF